MQWVLFFPGGFSGLHNSVEFFTINAFLYGQRKSVRYCATAIAQ
jgi:hypothetical protein